MRESNWVSEAGSPGKSPNQPTSLSPTSELPFREQVGALLVKQVQVRVPRTHG